MAFRDASLMLKSGESKSVQKKTADKLSSLVAHRDISNNIFFEFLDMRELANLSSVSKNAEQAVTSYLTKPSTSVADAKNSAANLWSRLAAILEEIAKGSEFQFQGKETFDSMEPMLNILVKTSQSPSQRWDIIKVDLLLNLIQESLIKVFETAREAFEKRIQTRKDEPQEAYDFYLALSHSIPLYIWSLVSMFKMMKQYDLKPNTPLNEKLLKLSAYFSQQQDIIFKHWIFLFIKDPKRAQQEWPSHLHLESDIDNRMLFGKQQTKPGIYQDVETDIPTHEHQYNALSFAAYRNLINLARYLILKKDALVNPEFKLNSIGTCYYGQSFCEFDHPPADSLAEGKSDEIYWFFLKQIKAIEKYKREQLTGVVDHHVTLFTSFFKKLKVDIGHRQRNEVWRKIFEKGISARDFQHVSKYLAIDRVGEVVNGYSYSYRNESTLSIAISVATKLRKWELPQNQKERVWSNQSGDLFGIIRLLLDEKAQPVCDDLSQAIKSLDVDLVKLLIPYKEINKYELEDCKNSLNEAREKLTTHSLFKSPPVDQAYKEISRIIKNPKKFRKEEKQNSPEYKRGP
ncbi:MAG: hypothetical protein ACYCQI_06760 [Gammaproteobacteria bacterium]